MTRPGFGPPGLLAPGSMPPRSARFGYESFRHDITHISRSDAHSCVARYADRVVDSLPLFPLPSVLFPGVVLPLHVFEERYRVLVQRLLEMPDGRPRRF